MSCLNQLSLPSKALYVCVCMYVCMYAYVFVCVYTRIGITLLQAVKVSVRVVPSNPIEPKLIPWTGKSFGNPNNPNNPNNRSREP